MIMQSGRASDNFVRGFRDFIETYLPRAQRKYPHGSLIWTFDGHRKYPHGSLIWTFDGRIESMTYLSGKERRQIARGGK